MAKLTNNILALVLVVAIVISVGGTAMSLMKLSGTATSGTATTDVTISELISITDTGDIDFGSGSVTAGQGRAGLQSNGTEDTNGTWAWAEQAIRITNNGNADVQINVNASSNASSWIGTGATADFAAEQGEVGACAGTLMNNWTVLHDFTQQSLCTVLQWEDANDLLNLTVQLGIPEALVGGGAAKQVTVKIWAAAD